MKLIVNLLNFVANIVESIQRNNKKTEKMSFFMKNSCIHSVLSMKKRYF